LLGSLFHSISFARSWDSFGRRRERDRAPLVGRSHRTIVAEILPLFRLVTGFSSPLNVTIFSPPRATVRPAIKRTYKRTRRKAGDMYISIYAVVIMRYRAHGSRTGRARIDNTRGRSTARKRERERERERKKGEVDPRERRRVIGGANQSNREIVFFRFSFFSPLFFFILPFFSPLPSLFH